MQLRPLVLLGLVTGLSHSLTGQTSERARANDNRTAAGILVGANLAVRLEARMGMWHPDGEERPGEAIPVFAELGRPFAQVPGPLIRAPGGTDVVVQVRNMLPATLTIHGLHARPAPMPAPGETFSDSMVLPPGTARTVRFRLDRPGTYYYWGTTNNSPFRARSHEDAQLTGAIVVDEPGERRPRDRIFVIGMWTDTAMSDTHRRRTRELTVLNGRVWPAGERVQYDKGDIARWRVINASVDAHPMHLHGFYYRVTRRGDGVTDTVQTPGDLVHTERVPAGGTFSATWVADRLGTWLFHCADAEHSLARGPLGYPTQVPATGMRPMGGLMNAAEVRFADEDTMAKVQPPPLPAATRFVRMVLRPNVGSTPTTPLYGIWLDEAGIEPTPPDTGQRAGKPLVLNKGEQTSVMVVNNLPEATSMHWHGLEVDAINDGVPNISGTKPIPPPKDAPPLPANAVVKSTYSPLIAPGDSFEVRLAPNRLGTASYHSHVNVLRQQRAGLVGTIIVAEKGKYDPTKDIAILVSSPSDSAAEETSVLFNGSLTPAAVELRRATPYRLRLVNLTTARSDLTIELKQDSTLATWRQVNRQGIELPLAERFPRPARTPITIGESRDFEITPLRVGDYRMEARTEAGALLGTLVVRVF